MKSSNHRKSVVTAFIALTWTITLVETTLAATIFVDECALPAGNGQAWGTAFNDLQMALDIAVATDQIWVAEGTYLPTDQVDPFDVRSVTFQLITGLAIYGGFPCGGGDGTFNARDPQVFVSTLSGDIGILGDSADNAFHVVTSNGTDLTTFLDGFTITDGNANGSSSGFFDRGGGMFNESGNPTVTNCALSGNSARFGGGMSNSNTSSPTVTNCIFSGNSATNDGGGMYNVSSSNPTVTNCTFSGSSAGDNGAGMFNDSSTPMVTNCTFVGNTAAGLGGGIYNNASNPTVDNCMFRGNSAVSDGGMSNIASNPTVTNCAFIGNIASGPSVLTSGQGGGMGNFNSSPTVTNCTFNGNLAHFSGGGMNNVQNSVLVQRELEKGLV